MNAPILKCRSEAEFQRVWKWLCESGIANTSRPCDLEIELGNHSPLGTKLETLKQSGELLNLAKKARAAIYETINHRPIKAAALWHELGNLICLCELE